MSPLESVDCIFQFFDEGPQFAVVEENTCNICIESSDFDCVADFSAVKISIQCFESIYCKNFSAVDVIICRQTNYHNVKHGWSVGLIWRAQVRPSKERHAVAGGHHSGGF